MYKCTYQFPAQILIWNCNFYCSITIQISKIKMAIVNILTYVVTNVTLFDHHYHFSPTDFFSSKLQQQCDTVLQILTSNRSPPFFIACFCNED